MAGFTEIWENFLADKLTDDQAVQLQQLIQQGDSQIVKAIDELLQDRSLANVAPVGREKQIWEKILIEIEAEEAPVISMERGEGRRWWKWVAAAAILFMVYGLWFIVRTQKDGKSERVEKDQIADVAAPDKTRAMITLADGRMISLDSFTTITQGDVQIVKTSEGKLIYEASQLTPHTSQLQYNTLHNPRGSKVIDIQLSDGSHVWLNAGSSVTYPVVFIGEERKVSMTGEAYFEIVNRQSSIVNGESKSRKIPFIVEKSGMQVEVLGTKFNVNAYDDESEIQVTLLEGSVKVSNTNSTSNNQSSALLKPGQQAAITSVTNDPIHHSQFTIHHPDLSAVLAWKNGLFDFAGADLETVMRQLGRWYDVEIDYQGPRPIANFRGTIPRQENVSQVLKMMEITKAVKFTIVGKKIIVTK